MTRTARRTGFRVRWCTIAAVGVLTAGCGSAGSAGNTQMTALSTYSSSSYYAYHVAVSNHLSSSVDGANITVQESGGAEEATAALTRGEGQISIATTASDYLAKNGKPPFRGKADNIRTLWYFAPSYFNYFVAKDSGVNGFDQLAGQGFNPGSRGSSTENASEEIFRVLDLKPKLARASGDDALESYQDRDIAGTVKAGLHPDSYILQAHNARSIKFLSLSDAQAEKVTSELPYLSKVDVEAKPQQYQGVSQKYTTVQMALGLIGSQDLGEDVVYKMVKSALSPEGIKAAASAYPPVRDVDIIELTIDSAVLPLHPGIIRYFEEQGHKVPDELKPPEYKS